MSARPFYITTPIYYVSDVPHLGHAYTTVVADALARYQRLRGRPTYFLTGTDEHGQKIARIAEERGQSPQAYADKIAAAYVAAWRALDISYDDFIRTTDPDHQEFVVELWRELEKKGEIVPGEYEGWYCVACEQFYTEKELDGEACPIHKRPVEKVKEESFYFKLSQYGAPLLARYRAHPELVLPEMRRNEVTRFVEQGLEDVSVSRTTFTWGVPVPDHPKHVVYVWIDALTNYYSATRRKQPRRPSGLAPPLPSGLTPASFWTDEAQIVHLIGKEISRFHAVYWPAVLMASGRPLPTTVFCHGWWTVDGQKMSKTAGNVVDPLVLAGDLGADAFRYFVLREVPLGADGDFSHAALITRYNAELANDLGNLLNRTLGMAHKYFEGGVVPERTPPETELLHARLPGLFEDFAAAMEAYQPSRALETLWSAVRLGNAYIDQMGPWKQDQEGRTRTLGNVLELCRVIAHLLSPFMPSTSPRLLAQLGLDEKPTWPSFDGRRGFRPAPAQPLFPRIDDDRRAALLAKWMGTVAPGAPPPLPRDSPGAPTSPSGNITYADFQKLDLRVGKVTAAEPVPKAKKLLKLVVDLGGESRQVVAGIAETYKPEELIGRSVIFLANLEPATIRGVLSEGMILAAGEEQVVALSALDRDAPPGTKVR